jgi:hypothetical protein
VNDSTGSIPSIIKTNPQEKKKLKESMSIEELNTSRWEKLIREPHKNYALIEAEFKSLEKSHVRKPCLN